MPITKRKGRDWLEDIAAFNSRQPQANATLDNIIVYSTDDLRNRSAFNHNLSDRTAVDGKMYPTANSLGQRIHPTDEGIKNFWRWFNGFRQRGLDEKDGQGENGRRDQGADSGAAGLTRDSRGRPRVYFHGTTEKFSVFDLDHPERKDEGWLGRGVYVTKDTDLADFSARQKGENPVRMGVHNPYVGTLASEQKLRWADQVEIARVTARRLKIAQPVTPTPCFRLELGLWYSSEH